MRFPSSCKELVVALVLSARILPSAGEDAASHPILSPAQYTLYPGLELSLFAREPDVVDPVALTFDEQGRMYVVEMRDYPIGRAPGEKPGGTIRLLEDRDHDGRAD